MKLQTPRLLITDDDAALRNTLGEVFRPRGFEPVLAESGEVALEIAQTHEVHLVLMDLHLPRQSGLDTISQLRQCRRILPCVLISAALDDAARRQAASIHVESVLSKPLSVREVTSEVASLMRRFYDWPN